MYKQPVVKLVNHTPDPEMTAYWNWQVMLSSNYPQTIKQVQISKIELDKWLEDVASEPHMAFLEAIHMNFSLENVSRALQQQLTRTRTASYCIQSLRVIECGNFASNCNYHCPSTVKNKAYFHNIMLSIEKSYNELLKEGNTVEDARGILPLNIFSPIHFSINFRNLIQVMESRLCVEAQGEINTVFKMIYEEVSRAMPKLAEVFLKSKCDKSKVCTSSRCCGKYPRKADVCLKLTKNEKGESGYQFTK